MFIIFYFQGGNTTLFLLLVKVGLVTTALQDNFDVSKLKCNEQMMLNGAF